MEDKIWRKLAVSSNYRLDQLGYAVLAAFDTMAYHLFEFDYHNNRYGIPFENELHDRMDMTGFRLCQMKMEIGDRIRMDYDFGTTQTFWIELVDTEDMKRGQGRRYPYIADGAGQGIIDDMDVGETKKLICQIDKKGKTKYSIYYKDRKNPWDYRRFALEHINALLKGEIECIEDGYAPFWRA